MEIEETSNVIKEEPSVGFVLQLQDSGNQVVDVIKAEAEQFDSLISENRTKFTVKEEQQEFAPLQVLKIESETKIEFIIEELPEEFNLNLPVDEDEFAVKEEPEVIVPYLPLNGYKSKKNSKSKVSKKKDRKKAKHECQICGVDWKYPSTLKLHMRKHERKKSISKFQCDICGELSTSKNKIKIHLFTHFSSMRFKCSVCDKSFKSETSLAQHSLTHSDEVFQCSSCFRTYKSLEYLRVHQKKVHSANKFHHPCSHCQRNFKNNQDRRRHEERKHYEGEKLQCPQCMKQLNSPFALKYHLRWMHEAELKFVCEICGAAFRHKSHLIIHKSGDHGESQDLKCSKCDMQFFNMWMLQGHYSRVHNKGTKSQIGLINTNKQTNQQNLECSKCFKVFKNELKFKVHLANTHTELKERIRKNNDSGKKFQCDLCGARFHTRKHVQAHLTQTRHVAHQNLKCPLCPLKSYKDKNSLQKHFRRSHKQHLSEYLLKNQQNLKFDGESKNPK